jgi:hypothetical protein
VSALCQKRTLTDSLSEKFFALKFGKEKRGYYIDREVWLFQTRSTTYFPLLEKNVYCATRLNIYLYSAGSHSGHFRQPRASMQALNKGTFVTETFSVDEPPLKLI